MKAGDVVSYRIFRLVGVTDTLDIVEESGRGVVEYVTPVGHAMVQLEGGEVRLFHEQDLKVVGEVER